MASGDVSPQPELSIELVAAVTGYTDTPAGHATYAVSCKVSAEGAGRWRSSVLVERRFKEFDKLHSALAPLLPLPKEVIKRGVRRRQLTERRVGTPRARAPIPCCYALRHRPRST